MEWNTGVRREGREGVRGGREGGREGGRGRGREGGREEGGRARLRWPCDDSHGTVERSEGIARGELVTSLGRKETSKNEPQLLYMYTYMYLATNTVFRPSCYNM